MKNLKNKALLAVAGAFTGLAVSAGAAFAAAGDAAAGDTPTVDYSGVKTGIFDQITAVLPTVIAVMATVIAITFGIRFLRKNVSKTS